MSPARSAPRRVADEPAFVLHSYDWSETSLIVEAFTRTQGRVALVAKGAKRPTSAFRPVLLPLQPVRLSYSPARDDAADIHTLKAADWAGGHVMPSGEALLSGLYLNELLLRLLARSDPHPGLFDAYAAVVRVLADHQAAALEPVLRSFELVLLRDVGLLPSLAVQTLTLSPLADATRYVLVPEGGLREAAPSDRSGLPGAQWCGLQQALDAPAGGFAAVLRACAPVSVELKPLLRTLLQYHCGPALLRTRQLMKDLQSL